MTHNLIHLLIGLLSAYARAQSAAHNVAKLLITTDNQNSITKHSTDTTHQLISFQLEKSGAEHLIIVMDSSFNEASSVLEASFDLGKGVTVVEYEPGSLSHYLKSFYNTNRAIKDILIACSLTNSIEILREVNEKRLETGHFQWFILTENPIDENITQVIYDENQVVIFEGSRKSGSKIEIKGMVWDEESKIRNIGWVTSNAAGLIDQKTKFPTIQDKFKNLQGRLFKVAANNYIVFFRQRTLEDGSLAPWEGVDVNIVRTLAKIHKFKYVIVHPEDGRWGGPSKDGSISGLIGLVARHEASLAIHEITITEIRETVVDFTKPYYTERSSLVSKAPPLKNLALAVITPFQYPVWGLLFGSLFIMGFVAMVVDQFARQHLFPEKHLGNKKLSLQDLYSYYLFNMLRNLVLQGNRIKSPSSSTRLIMGVWFLISLIIYALYSGTLCAVFAAPSYLDPINSLLDLLKAAKERNVYPIVTAGTAISYLFEQATFGTHKEIYQHFDPVKSRVGYDERYSQAAKGSAVIMSSSISNIIKSNIYGRDKYHIGTEHFFFQSYGIALSNGSPMKFIFSKTLQRLIEGGFIRKWVEEGVNNELRYNCIMHGDQGNLVSRRRSVNNPISLIQLQAAFFILVLGWFLSFIAFLLEISYFKLS